MEMRTGSASPPAPASPPSLSFSNHWVFLRAVPLAKSPPNFRPKAEVGAESGDRPLLTSPSFLPSF